MLKRLLLRRILSPLNSVVFRASRGRIAGRMGGLPVLLLITTGRTSGKQRTAPLLYVRDAETYVVVASFGGQPKHPAWYLNLEADPRARIHVGDAELAVTAKTAHGTERDRFWKLMTQGYAGYDGYQRKTEREIPVVVLRPIQAARRTALR